MFALTLILDLQPVYSKLQKPLFQMKDDNLSGLRTWLNARESKKVVNHTDFKHLKSARVARSRVNE